MMIEYEMTLAEGKSKGMLKWYRRQMKKQVGLRLEWLLPAALTKKSTPSCILTKKRSPPPL